MKAPGVPPAVLSRAASEPVAVPPQMEGWSWATLDGFIDLGELDALLAEAAEQADAPALAFSVHDSDSVYVVGGDGSGVRFRLVVNPEAWEDELPRQEVEGAAAWSKDHAALEPSPEEIAQILARQFVFAEEGLDVLLARMGLLPASAAEGAEAADEAFSPASEIWQTFGAIDEPEAQRLERGRWHATLEHGAVRGHLLAAEEPGDWVSAYGVRNGEPIVHLGKARTREELWDEGTRQGITLGPWEDVPDDVPRDLASTAAWLVRG